MFYPDVHRQFVGKMTESPQTIHWLNMVEKVMVPHQDCLKLGVYSIYKKSSTILKLGYSIRR
jgi:hypothetical protein